MKTILYYFTGTGNSLAVAKAISTRLPETELAPIPKCMLIGEKITVRDDANVGIVYPLYAMGLPKIVVNFFALLDLSHAGYVFSVVTEGGKSGSPTKQISALCEKSGHKLNAAWWIQMPDNYIPLNSPPEKSIEKTIRENALRKVAVIVEDVKERRGSTVGFTAVGSILRVMYAPFIGNIHNFDKKFVVSSACNGCLICAKICPVNNIRPLPHGKKEWLHTCEGCLACLQFCPVEAISCGGKTDNRPRYHHANATVADMLEQKGSVETK
ncbi:MAG TPA: EFR1 family ferrodoxin [Methanocorpusculum sp.]|nr:EFR1 family ferrodoxin [Methanocorpusculum sp.]